MSLEPFTVQGNTVAATSSGSTASTPIQVIGNLNSCAYQLQNFTGIRQYYLMLPSIPNGDGTFTSPSGTVTNPTTGGNGQLIPPNSTIVVQGPPNATFFFRSQAGILTVYATPGEGDYAS